MALFPFLYCFGKCELGRFTMKCIRFALSLKFHPSFSFCQEPLKNLFLFSRVLAAPLQQILSSSLVLHSCHCSNVDEREDWAQQAQLLMLVNHQLSAGLFRIPCNHRMGIISFTAGQRHSAYILCCREIRNTCSLCSLRRNVILHIVP